MCKARCRRILWAGLLAMFVVGCAGHRHQEQVLPPPAGAEPAGRMGIEQGNRFFAAHQWEAAKKEYEGALDIQPSLAEAHYNLGLALMQLGDPNEARHHFMEAANLAPGNKVIWNSPPLRRHGNVHTKAEAEATESEGGHSH